MRRAVAIARASDGAFDPTIGPLVAIWRVARQSKALPDPAELARARTLVGWRLLQLDPANQTIRLNKRGMRLDLGGIAKGYILQEAIATLRTHGTPRAMVEAGGDIVAGEPPPDRTGWRIDVPGTSVEFRARATALTNAALSTSGATAQFVVIDGTRYSHIVDPRTGLGVTNGFLAHVIAADAATADAIATALTVLGVEGSRGLLPQFPGVLASVHLSGVVR
jgi:thiamine biosynthesis lipoprotein